MALCPECHRHFNVLEDEQPDYCPYCGYEEPETEEEEDDA